MSDQKYQRIWETVSLVPTGSVATYGQIADLAGLPGRARLVGKALGKTPEHIDIPWYRIINAQGKISFPKGSEQFSSQSGKLLEENVVVLNGRVRLKEFQWRPDMTELLLKLKY